MITSRENIIVLDSKNKATSVTLTSPKKLLIDGEFTDDALDKSRGAGAYSILLGASTGVVTTGQWTDFLNTTLEEDEELIYNSELFVDEFIYHGTRNGVFMMNYSVKVSGVATTGIEVGISINDEAPRASSITKATLTTEPSIFVCSYLDTLENGDTFRLQFRNTNGTTGITPSVLSLNFIGPF